MLSVKIDKKAVEQIKEKYISDAYHILMRFKNSDWFQKFFEPRIEKFGSEEEAVKHYLNEYVFTLNGLRNNFPSTLIGQIKIKK